MDESGEVVFNIPVLSEHLKWVAASLPHLELSLALPEPRTLPLLEATEEDIRQASLDLASIPDAEHRAQAIEVILATFQKVASPAIGICKYALAAESVLNEVEKLASLGGSLPLRAGALDPPNTN